MDKNLIIGAVVVVALLIVLNLLIIFGVFDSRVCQQVENYNVYVCGEHNPAQEIKDLVKNSYHVDVVFESDKDKTQKGAYITQAIMALAGQLHNHDVQYYGIEYENGFATGCQNTMNLTVQQCLNFVPAKDTALIYIKYPEGGSKSEIEIKGNTIYFRAHTSTYLINLIDVVFAYIINS